MKGVDERWKETEDRVARCQTDLVGRTCLFYATRTTSFFWRAIAHSTNCCGCLEGAFVVLCFSCCEVTRWRHKSIHWQVCLSKSLLSLTFAKLRRRGSTLLFPRVVMASEGKGSCHDCLDYETPSKQYENGPIAYF